MNPSPFVLKIEVKSDAEVFIMKYEFLVDTYETDRVKVLSVWSEFRDEDLPVRTGSGLALLML